VASISKREGACALLPQAGEGVTRSVTDEGLQPLNSSGIAVENIRPEILNHSPALIRPAIALRYAQGVTKLDGRAKRALWPATFSRTREKGAHVPFA
jgi:hypothetical protein